MALRVLTRICVTSSAMLIGKRFVTTRDEESAVGTSDDDVFLAEEETQSFQQQVAFMKTPGFLQIQQNVMVPMYMYYAGVPGDV